MKNVLILTALIYIASSCSLPNNKSVKQKGNPVYKRHDYSKTLLKANEEEKNEVTKKDVAEQAIENYFVKMRDLHFDTTTFITNTFFNPEERCIEESYYLEFLYYCKNLYKVYDGMMQKIEKNIVCDNTEYGILEILIETSREKSKLFKYSICKLISEFTGDSFFDFDIKYENTKFSLPRVLNSLVMEESQNLGTKFFLLEYKVNGICDDLFSYFLLHNKKYLVDFENSKLNRNTVFSKIEIIHQYSSVSTNFDLMILIFSIMWVILILIVEMPYEMQLDTIIFILLLVYFKYRKLSINRYDKYYIISSQTIPYSLKRQGNITMNFLERLFL